MKQRSFGPTNGALLIDRDKATFGRCMGIHNDRVYYWRKSSKARLKDMRCPDCGDFMHQTTTLFHGRYVFITADEVERIVKKEPS